MMSTLDDKLNAILEDEATIVSPDAYQNIQNIQSELTDARARVTQLERDLAQARDRLCGGLALGIRRCQPGLNVSLGDGACRAAYLTKNLTFRPDFDKNVWQIESSHPRFGSRFRRAHGHAAHLSSNLDPFARAIADFFTTFYKSIGESISGRGGINVSGRPVTYSHLVELVHKKDKLVCETYNRIW